MNIRPEDCSREELEWYIKEGSPYDDWTFQMAVLNRRYGQAQKKQFHEHRAAMEALRRCRRLVKPYDMNASRMPYEKIRRAMQAMEDYHSHCEEEIRCQRMAEAFRDEIDALYDQR